MSLKYPNLLIVFQESNLRPHILDFLSTQSAVLGQTSLKPLKCQHTRQGLLIRLTTVRNSSTSFQPAARKFARAHVILT